MNISSDLKNGKPTDEEFENRLASMIQVSVPFVPEPYLEIANVLGVDENLVLEQLKKWSEEGKLREICGVFEGDILGYESALAVGNVDDSKIERIASILNEHPTITHNYRRDHAFNLWFTIAAPKEVGVAAYLDILSRITGGEHFFTMKRTKTFKIGIKFDLDAKENKTVIKAKKKLEPIEITDKDKLMIRALQRDLPYQTRPFKHLAGMFDLTEGDLLQFGLKHQTKLIRRYGGTFRHRKLGVQGNGMVVWKVDQNLLEEMGHAVAQQPEVSHCYARNPIEGFPYTLYSMVHGPDQTHCSQVAERISGKLNIKDYIILFSTHEFKKCRLRYFLPELNTWWQRYRA